MIPCLKQEEKLSYNVCPETVLLEVHFSVKYSNWLLSSVTSNDVKARACIQDTVHVGRMITECTRDAVQPTLPSVDESC